MLNKINIMLDLETLSLNTNCVILQIGAIDFDTKFNVINKFYTNISITDQINIGRHLDDNTFKWWTEQAPTAQRNVLSVSRSPLKESLNSFASWYKSRTIFGVKDAALFANHSEFDIAALGSLYDDVNIARPWHFKSPRDLATLKQLAKSKNLDIIWSNAVTHVALDDCKAQIADLQQIVELLTK